MPQPLHVSTTGFATPASSSRTPLSSAMLYTATPTTAGTPFRKEDFSFLPQLFDILQAVQTPGDDLNEVGRLISRFNERIQNCVRILDDLPGADLLREEQKRLLKKEEETLEKRRAQLAKYHQLPVFTKLNASLPQDPDLNRTVHEEVKVESTPMDLDD